MKRERHLDPITNTTIEEMVMSDTLKQTAQDTTVKTTGDNTPDPGDCCTAPPGGDPGPST